MMDLIRHDVREMLELFSLFIIKGDGSEALKKWFSGEIIPNRESRKAIDKEHEE
jgi:hypothetical protein